MVNYPPEVTSALEASAVPAGPGDETAAIEGDDEPTRWLSAGEQRDWRSFYYSTLRLLEAMDRDLMQEFGIPLGYYEVFVRLSEAPEQSMRMSELATATRSSRSRLSHAVARLEEKGWVERVDCATDRRGQVAHLTDAGMALLARAAPSHVRSVRHLLIDALTPQQMSDLGEIGRTIYLNVTGEPVFPG